MSVISSVLHLFLSTVPFLALFSYFLYSASKRPQIIQELYIYYNEENGNNNNNNNQGQEDPLTLISLSSMLTTFLLTLIIWSSLAIYLAFFVRKRRKLMESYSGSGSATPSSFSGGVTQVIGDVYYEHPIGCCAKTCNKMHRTDIAYVTYPYPYACEHSSSHPNTTTTITTNGDDTSNSMMVQKKIRTYHEYHREKVAVLILPNKPLSGQPLADVERDVLSYQSEYAVRNSSRMNQVLIVCILWIIFCTSGALYILKQMDAANDAVNDVANRGWDVNEEDEEDLDAAWRNFWLATCIGIPLIAGGGNLLRWILYKRWVVDSGSVLPVSMVTKVPPKAIQPEELHYDEEGGFTLFTCT